MTAAISGRGTGMTVASDRRERLGAAAVYLVGAVVYFIAREWLGLRFMASPFFLGMVMLVASYFRPRLLASATLLAIWGTAVLLNGKFIWADGRSDAVYLAAFGLGALVLVALQRWVDPRVSLETVGIVMLVTGVWYYLAYDYDALVKTWVWSLAMVVSAAALALTMFVPRRGVSSDRAAADGSPARSGVGTHLP